MVNFSEQNAVEGEQGGSVHWGKEDGPVGEEKHEQMEQNVWEKGQNLPDEYPLN